MPPGIWQNLESRGWGTLASEQRAGAHAKGNWRGVRRTLPDECSGDTHHFFAADFFAFFGAGAAAAFFAIAESDGGDGGEERLLPNWGSRVPGRSENAKKTHFIQRAAKRNSYAFPRSSGMPPGIWQNLGIPRMRDLRTPP